LTITPPSSGIYGAKGLAYIKVNDRKAGEEGLAIADRQVPAERRG
jgi:hypothetical protein